MKQKKYRVIVSGGGTGGHIFPAVSIANAIKDIYPSTEFLFVGALGRMEMEKVPAAGYKIIGLPVRGFNRKNLFKNISVVKDLIKSLFLARKAIKEFNPDVAVGVGGYASGPTLKIASMMGIPTVIQEQNSYAGVTNKLLASKAEAICVAYDNMERFFPKDKIVLTGNPVRQTLTENNISKEEAFNYFNLDSKKKTILVIGGSLGARTINQSIAKGLNYFQKEDIQVIWQTGANYYDNAKKELDNSNTPNIKAMPFISRMDFAYSIADIVISRAGASSISELCLLEKAAILVPSPNVAEDHQTKNAMALVNKDAAVMVADANAQTSLVDTAIRLVSNKSKVSLLKDNISKLAFNNAARKIAQIVIECASKKV
ncbi:MAG: undecaprenyldiphospho-muramoylpentapeptide beta-N-acetylglucosaminyltransferase [Bacteroidales bacterium]|nr:undecaprenyldiphospho-muramoylpentapeptide beta-N-acetylglucosaminyltransferase [Bacteroidales bacterium]